MLDVSTREYKNERIQELLSIDISLYQLDTIDERLLLYVEEVRNHAERHNLYELLAVIKFFRLMDTYVFRPSKVRNSLNFTRVLNSPAWMAEDAIN